MKDSPWLQVRGQPCDRRPGVGKRLGCSAATRSLPRTAMDAAGNATVVFGNGFGEIRAIGHPAGGEWEPEVQINPGGGRVGPSLDVVVDAHGDALAAWTDATGPRPSIVTARRAGGAWQPPARLTADERSAAEPDLAADPSGNGVAVWSDSTSGVISAAGFDATPPELRGLTVPSSGAAGRPMSFSATPFDVWSAPLATRWTFGDGATATGNAVSHTYSVVGRQHPRGHDDGPRRQHGRRDEVDPDQAVRAGAACRTERVPAQATGHAELPARGREHGALHRRSRAGRAARGQALRHGHAQQPPPRVVYALRAGRLVLALASQRQHTVQGANSGRRPRACGRALPAVRNASRRRSDREGVAHRLPHHRLIVAHRTSLKSGRYAVLRTVAVVRMIAPGRRGGWR